MKNFFRLFVVFFYLTGFIGLSGYVKTAVAQSKQNLRAPYYENYNNIYLSEKKWWSADYDRLYNRFLVETMSSSGKAYENYRKLSVLEACFGNNEGALRLADSAMFFASKYEERAFASIEKSEFLMKEGLYEEAFVAISFSRNRDFPVLNAFLRCQEAKIFIATANFERAETALNYAADTFDVYRDELGKIITLTLKSEILLRYHETEKAIELAFTALDIAESMPDKFEILEILNLIGRIQIENNDFNSAYDNFSSALSIGNKEEYPYFFMQNSLALAELFLLQNEDEKFSNALFNAEHLAQQKGENIVLLACYELWKNHYRAEDNEAQLLLTLDKYAKLLKRIVREKEKSKTQLFDQHFEHQEEHFVSENLKRENEALHIYSERYIFLLTVISFFLVISVAILIRYFVILKRLQSERLGSVSLRQQLSQKDAGLNVLQNEVSRLKEKNNNLASQNESISQKNLIAQTLLEHYETDIKKLQQAVLQNAEFVRNNFVEFFSYRNTKEDLSGNFLWTGLVANQSGEFQDKILFVMIDNAYSSAKSVIQSVLCAEILNNIAYEHRLENLREISNRLYGELKKINLSYKTVTPVERFLKFSLALYDKTNRQIDVLDENNHICIVKDGVFVDNHEKFYTVKFESISRVILYAYSDGFQDQIGSGTKRKFGKNRFRALLAEMHYEKLVKQKKLCEETFNGWRADAELISDVFVAGILISEGRW